MDEINQKQIEHLQNLIQTVKNSEMKLVFIRDIKNNISDAIEIPSWIRTQSKWWADGQIDDQTFVSGIQFLIKQNIIKIPLTTPNTDPTNEIPAWFKNNAKWWSNGLITESDFVKGIQFLSLTVQLGLY